ncbi:MAG: NAD(P)-dependent oxidoreductase [Bilophila wadsworthia]
MQLASTKRDHRGRARHRRGDLPPARAGLRGRGHQVRRLCAGTGTHLDRGACELFGATVGIVGLGGIGRALAPPCGLRGNGRGLRSLWPEDFAQEHGIRRVNLDELFAVSDIVTLHCPLMDATRGLVDAARLASMKPGAILVNAARGGIGRNGLCRRLERGGTGSGHRQLESEIPSPGNPLLRLSRSAPPGAVLPHPRASPARRCTPDPSGHRQSGNSLRDFPQFSVNGLSSIRPSA